MKKLIALVSVVFAITNMSAQLKVHSNGNVSIKTTETPNATLAIGGVGLPTQSLLCEIQKCPIASGKGWCCDNEWGLVLWSRRYKSCNRYPNDNRCEFSGVDT